ncbi:MAG: hypothetical protein M1536_02545, partial [Firmicutes bacterium]|nr:hypothetical protein [Bacillota bacterium]
PLNIREAPAGGRTDNSSLNLVSAESIDPAGAPGGFSLPIREAEFTSRNPFKVVFVSSSPKELPARKGKIKKRKNKEDINLFT